MSRKKDIPIIVAGTYLLNGGHSMSKSVVYITGDAGGATLDIHGFGGAIIDATGLLVGSQIEIRHGSDSDISLVVTGGAGIDLVVRCVGIH